MTLPDPRIVAVCRAPGHRMAKPAVASIRLLAGLGVEGDSHCGHVVRHRYLAARDPQRPNLRQVHLIECELLDELREAGFDLVPGAMGENVTTTGLALTALPLGTMLRLGGTAVVEVAGLRDPCRLLDRLLPGLMAAVTGRSADGAAMFRGAVMGVVVAGGDVAAGDGIGVAMPPLPHRALPVI